MTSLSHALASPVPSSLYSSGCVDCLDIDASTSLPLLVDADWMAQDDLLCKSDDLTVSWYPGGVHGLAIVSFDDLII